MALESSPYQKESNGISVILCLGGEIAFNKFYYLLKKFSF